MVTTGRLIDRESVSHYSLTVMACHTDNAAAAAAADGCSTNISLPLSIKVIDVNDHSPRFDQTSYSTTLYGHERLGTSVIRLTASDDDASRLNSFITYRLDSLAPASTPGGPLFAVNPLSGWMTVAGRLDQVDGRVTLRVVAEDLGEPVRSTTTSVLINVLSERPRITSPPQNATIPLHQVYHCLNKYERYYGPGGRPLAYLL